jgi:hypothetical protein
VKWKTLFKPIYAILYLVLSTSSWALIQFDDAIYGELATSGRALSMGNAYIAKVDDASSAFYNPAGLGTVRYPHFHISNVHLEVNKGWWDVSTTDSLTEVPGNFAKALKIEELRKMLLTQRGKLSYSRFHIMPNFTARFFSMGYLYSTNTKGTIGKESTALFEYSDRVDSGPYAALNLSLGGGIFKLGVTGIYLTRKEVIAESDRDTVLNIEDSDYNIGTSFLMIFGSKLTLPVTALPTFAIKVNNVSSKEFGVDSGGAGAPAKIKPSIDVGFSLTPGRSKSSRLHIEVNYKDITKKYADVGSARRWAGGFEWDWGRVFFTRLGFSDGFGAGGIGLRTRPMELDIGTYAVDTTTSEFRGKADRRYFFNLSSGF